MPRFITKDLKGKKLYFDQRPNGAGEKPEGFWASPIFASDEKEKNQELKARGLESQLWIEMLCDKVTGWVGYENMLGKELACTPENIRELADSDFLTMFDMYKRLQAAALFGQLVTEKN